jgi:hypothetical protein
LNHHIKREEAMSLLRVLVQILLLWRPAFKKRECFNRALQHAIAGILPKDRGTITHVITTLGREGRDWSADYKLYSKRTWKAADLFLPIIEKALTFANEHFMAIAADDTKLRKTGKKIATASWQRDPMGPHFQTNLIWAQRFLHFSYLLPLYNIDSEKGVPPRSLPINFTEAASVKKPGRKASLEQIKTYEEEKKKRNISISFVEEARKIRNTVDELGEKEKKILFIVDNGYCNRICLRANIERADILARCRKDAKLCFAAELGSRRYYDVKKFTPEEVRQDQSIPWQLTRIFHGGQWREVHYKELSDVRWQRIGRKPFRLFVLRPVRYRLTKNGKAYYREPGYLLSTASDAPAPNQIQAYFDRWQIEVNHREIKTIIGVGQAQVRNQQSVHRQPAFMVAAYSALLLTSVLLYGDQRSEELCPLPKWYRKSKRPSCRQLTFQLRKELLKEPQPLEMTGININVESLLRKTAA